MRAPLPASVSPTRPAPSCSACSTASARMSAFYHAVDRRAGGVEWIVMDGLVSLAIVAFVMLFAASLPYVFVESRWRWRWREVPAGRVAADGASVGVYRAGGEVPRYLHEAPRLVRWTAFT